MSDDIEPITAPVKDDPTDEQTDPLPIRHRDLAEWRGRDLIDSDGERVGPLEDVYYDVDDDQPVFGTVKEGFLSRHLTFVPLAGATIGPDSIQVTANAEAIKTAPNLDSGSEQLTPEDEAALFHHYHLNYFTPERESQRRLIRH